MRKLYWRGDFFCHPANTIYTLPQILDKILNIKKIALKCTNEYTLSCIAIDGVTEKSPRQAITCYHEYPAKNSRKRTEDPNAKSRLWTSNRAFSDAHFHFFRFLSVYPKCLVGKNPHFYFFFFVYMMDFRTMSNLAAV